MSFKVAAFHFAVIAFGLFFGAAGAADARTIQLVGLGDSLMAGYQLPPGDGFPAKLEAALKAKGLDVAIADAGVSGDTSSGGLSRVDWSVPDGTDGVILELGANDALRGIPPEQTEKNLDAILSRLKERNIPVLLAGMLAPPNMGPDYAAKFNPIYKRLADKYQLPLYPFFLDGVATHADLQLNDGMHPNPQGVDVMVQRFQTRSDEFHWDDCRTREIGACTDCNCMIPCCYLQEIRGVLVMPRLFTALEIPRNAAMSLSLLRGGLPGARWIDVENYHITLRFIGDVDGRTADEIVERLDRIDRPEFQLRLEGIGSFGSKKPHSVWAGVTQTPDMYALQGEIERICQRIGLPPDPRKFTPHVTLARLKSSRVDDVVHYLSGRGNFYTAPFTVGRFVLLSSRESVGGGPYLTEEIFPLHEARSAFPATGNNALQPAKSMV